MSENVLVIGNQTGDHVLQHRYCFWYIHRDQNGRQVNMPAQDYEKSIKQIGEFDSIEGFWKIYNHISKPSDIPATSELHMFRSGIKPIWEDEQNRAGGKLMVRLTKGLASSFWEAVLIAIMGENFGGLGEEVCGVVISVRQNEDILSVWNRTADNPAVINKMREVLREVIGAPMWIRMDYRRHEKRLRQGSQSRGPDEQARGTGWRT